MRRGWLVFLFLSLLSLLSCRVPLSQKYQEQRPFNAGEGGKGPVLAVIGDSLSSGVIAGTKLGEGMDRAFTARFLSVALGPRHQLDAFQGPLSDLARSATATDQDWGVRAALGRRVGLPASEIPLRFAANWGGTTRDVAKYLQSLRVAYDRSGRSADYVLYLIGGNNYCEGQTPEDFAKSYEESLRSIIDAHPTAQLFITVLLPHVDMILKHEFQYSPTLSCEVFRRNYCPAFFKEAGMHQRILDYNIGIRRSVAALRKEKPEAKLLLVSRLEQMLIEREDLAFDCFHLSERGQKKFASALTQALDFK